MPAYVWAQAVYKLHCDVVKIEADWCEVGPGNKNII